jgi:hypothetical protein
MQNVRTRQNAGEHRRYWQVYGNWGFGATRRWQYDLILVSVNPVILFIKGGH